MYRIYKYDNTIFTLSLTGAELKAIMERYAGNFFQQYCEGDVTIAFDPEIRTYNFDQYAGIEL